jgi:hypoxanthine phosphoribosyltransferase
MKYGYDSFHYDINKLIDEINTQGAAYDYIVGIVRGGSIPAAVLSYNLGLPMKCVSWSTYHRDQMKETALDIAEDIMSGKKILVVDDILDSGRTIKELIEDWDVKREQFDLAVLIWNTKQDQKPDFYGRTIDRESNSDWITFWWEDINGFAN